ncbi:hypothetical protein [Brucella sp. IR073]|uniref:hypothetical protein n=1 Tax=unclassified Brucella TaxID=2632610 RepID=UPI003B98359F
MTTRVIETPWDRQLLFKYIEQQKGPITVTITKGKHRTTDQNRLQRLWVKEIAEQRCEPTEDVRAYCKLHIGIPILRNENEGFRAEYDAVIRPLPYETKLRMMKVPLDWAVTRLMTTKQLTAYLDEVHRTFSEQGIVLTNPEDRRWETARAAA